jgi:hypothetical protein
MTALQCVLPCPVCRESYQKYSRDKLPKVLPRDMGDFVVDVHDMVNLKLDKPAAEEPASVWKERQLTKFSRDGYASYVEDMFYFLFTVTANYPLAFTDRTTLAKHYEELFTQVAQAMSPHRPWGIQMTNYLALRPIGPTLEQGRNALMEWLYGLYRIVMPENQQHSLKTIQATMEKIRRH